MAPDGPALTTSVYEAVIISHSLLRWGVLALGAVFTLDVIQGALSGRRWTQLDERLGFFFIGAVDLEMTFGLLLYLWLSPIIPAGFAAGAGHLFTDPVLLFFTVVHPVGMILGVVLAHIGHARRKAASSDAAKFKAQVLALVPWAFVVAAMIPWPWFSYGRGLGRWW